MAAIISEEWKDMVYREVKRSVTLCVNSLGVQLQVKGSRYMPLWV